MKRGVNKLCRFFDSELLKYFEICKAVSIDRLSGRFLNNGAEILV